MAIENIDDLEKQARTVFTESGYTEKSMQPKLVIAKAITQLHNEQGAEQWNEGIVSDYIQTKELNCQNGKISVRRLGQFKLAVRQFAQINEFGAITHKPFSNLPDLPDAFKQILLDIHAYSEWNHKAQKHVSSHANIFFRWLCSNGHSDMSRVDECVVREYFIDCSSRLAAISLDNTRRALKQFFLFISENRVLSESMNKLFLFKIPIDKKIKPFMPQDEIAAVLNIIDRSTIKGKRDYAIILLATVTGLRKVDIVNLTKDSFDWRNGEMRIIQEKTGNSLALPLTTDVGKAVRDYIINARPHSKSDKVFLNTKAPFSGTSPGNLGKILKTYCIKAGLRKHWGFHSLRRSIATNMIISGTSVVTVAQALGTKNIGSTKPYISLDSINLKECALDFSGIQVGGEVA